MSYQGGSTPGSGYWPDHDPPNVYGMQGSRPQLSHIGTPAPYEQAAFNSSQNGHYWNQNGHMQHGITPGLSNNGYYAQAPAQPQYQQPQYISPAALLQHQAPSQPRPSQQYQRIPETSSGSRKLSTPIKNTSRMAPAPPVNTQLEMDRLLISLAEEYFEAAHDLAPAVSQSMTAADVDSYSQLIATGLGCLDAALKHVQLGPRVEANIRLRYAAVLYEETENAMEAETTLSRGIALCQRQHYYDLQYAMQFLLAQFMARKSPKASMKALDGHISEAQAYQHFSWVYVFRFLRASQALNSPSSLDNHAAVQNLQAIASLASQQGDHAIHMTASLMEALAYLKSSSPDATQHVQHAIAAARSHQTEPSCQISQLVGLTHILDVASAIRQGTPGVMLPKLQDMQKMIDGALKDPSWSTTSDVIAIPINRTKKSSDTVSPDTRMVLGIGDDGGDVLMMSFLNKNDARSVTFLLSGMVLLHRNCSDQKGLKFLQAGLENLEGDARATKLSSGLLPDLVAKRQWRGRVLCYVRMYMAFCWAALADWGQVKRCVDELRTTATAFEVSLTGPLGYLMFYITGVYHQGIGDLETALEIFQDDRLKLSTATNSVTTSADQVERDVALLAALNTLWILQDGQRKDPDNNVVLIDQLEPFCANHPNKEIQTAFNLIMATVSTNPPAPLFKVKKYLGAALKGAQNTGNTQFLCITLSVMCDRFFHGVVGHQAEQSAKAAVVQATNSGNPLWKSVAHGMLSQCYDVQGNKEQEARQSLEQAVMFSRKAMPNS